MQFAYNGDGVRLGKTVNGVATSYLQDVAAPLPVVLSETTGGQTSRYVYGSDLLMLEDPAGMPAFYHTDGLGSTRALSNVAGQRTDAYSYDVFGAMRSHSGGVAQSFTFTGEQADGELGLVYSAGSVYDPAVGRFISADTFPGSDLLTQTWNRYSYAQNNPILFEDQDGHFWNFVAGAAAGVLEYTVKVGVQNVMEGKPLSQAFERMGSRSGCNKRCKRGSCIWIRAWPCWRSVGIGCADAAGSALRQYQTSGSVDVKQAAAEGVVGGVVSYGVGKAFGYPHPYVRGALPTGKYIETALIRRACATGISSGDLPRRGALTT